MSRMRNRWFLVLASIAGLIFLLVATSGNAHAATITSGTTSPAATTLEAWASQTLGVTISPASARHLARSGSRTITTPGIQHSPVTVTVKGAVEAFAGKQSDGGAEVLAIGKGNVTGDVSVDISAASLGCIRLPYTGTAPADSASALTLLTTTYPGVANLTYSPLTTRTGNYAFAATTTTTYTDPATSQPVTVVKKVVLGFITVRGKSWTYAFVGNGAYSGTLPSAS